MCTNLREVEWHYLVSSVFQASNLLGNKSCGIRLNIFGRNLQCLQLEVGIVYFVLPQLLYVHPATTVTLSQSWYERCSETKWIGNTFLVQSWPLLDYPGNSTVTVLEFIEYEDWCFVVMPFSDGYDEVPFCNAAEVLVVPNRSCL